MSAPLDLEALEALATNSDRFPGPLEFRLDDTEDGPAGRIVGRHPRREGHEMVVADVVWSPGSYIYEAEANGELLVGATNALPALIAELREARTEREALRTALEEAERWMGDPEDPTGNADAAADRFYVATGLMAPFKDQAQAMGGGDEQERRDAWSAWTKQERKRVWALVTATLRGES